jgi:putative oxidoreductase
MRRTTRQPGGKPPTVPKVSACLRISFGLVFVFSSLLKMTNLAAFTRSLGDFGLLPGPLLSPTALLIPLGEFVIGAAIALGIATSGMTQACVGLLAVFTAVVAGKLLERADISCGCFGSLSSGRITGQTALRNLILMAWGVGLFVHYSSASASARTGRRARTGQMDLAEEAIGQQGARAGTEQFRQTLGRILGFALVLFLGSEVVLLATQNKELKSRLALLVGQTNREPLKPGELLPPFLASDLSGRHVTIGYGPSTGETVIFLFSTGCTACKRNLSNWEQIGRQAAEMGARLLAVSLDAPDATANYAVEHRLAYPVLVTSDSMFVRYYRPFLTPQTLLIDAHGRVQKVWLGLLEGQDVEDVLGHLRPPERP